MSKISGKATKSVSDSRRARRSTMIGAVVVVLAAVVLFAVYRNSQSANGGTAGGSGFEHVAGQPGTGTAAPGFTLTSDTGSQVGLADFRGKSVLLYFQEGLSCQPCWDQIRDLEKNRPALKAAGVDTVVSITTDPADLIGRKVTDEKLSTSVLSDPTMRVSQAYRANSYGMMGDTRDGHSFVLVGPDGTIRWRADYGGAPAYTMFLPTQKMLADLTAERAP
ncbi:peroxiredoxin family protein [Amycolatopsis sp. H20-H5]|uniref:peroxiredoxin family protein n=1 Tax=Amycolatopsis sp. H20-H5 TaxID=3046309 RepID=UPI002DBE3538|nr:peroxiredoxin family protein [Amycolatopsis sp. H20-H5]MEC3982705.1 peroxiredoxin family protein [Amycolatopsis sp. H20-H5]